MNLLKKSYGANSREQITNKYPSKNAQSQKDVSNVAEKSIFCQEMKNLLLTGT